jgi:hypothetical protein
MFGEDGERRTEVAGFPLQENGLVAVSDCRSTVTRSTVT